MARSPDNADGTFFFLVIGPGEWSKLFMPYDEFPWFRDAPVAKIVNVEEPAPGHFYWPELDVDLTIEHIEHPERFPLKARP